LQVQDDCQSRRRDRSALAAAHPHSVNTPLDLTKSWRGHAINDAFARHLYRHGEQWFMFLPGSAPPTPNCPAVVNHKVLDGNCTAVAEAQVC
jgi:hypothetical protein